MEILYKMYMGINVHGNFTWEFYRELECQRKIKINCLR